MRLFSFFEVFGFPFSAGDGNSVLQENYAIVISQRVAKLFFGIAKKGRSKIDHFWNFWDIWKNDFFWPGGLDQSWG